jgi:hypothetical protein
MINLTALVTSINSHTQLHDLLTFVAGLNDFAGRKVVTTTTQYVESCSALPLDLRTSPHHDSTAAPRLQPESCRLTLPYVRETNLASIQKATLLATEDVHHEY